MPNTKWTALIVCPFFCRETGRDIYCEGVMDGSVTVCRFEDKQKKEAHQEYACITQHYKERCSLAMLLDEKYQ